MIETNLWLIVGLLLLAGTAAEFISFWAQNYRNRSLLIGLSAICTMFAFGVVLVLVPTIIMFLLAAASAYRFINSLRLLHPKIPRPVLRRIVSRVSTIMLIGQLLIAVGYWAYLMLDTDVYIGVFDILVGVGAAIALVMFITTLSVFKAERKSNGVSTDLEAPTVSVLIAARNESTKVIACLDSVLATTYKKLEIIVLDDNSQDDTPEIIKQFAHSGVRFIAGKNVPRRWLAKNHAYERLASEASGSILMFVGVDVRIEPTMVEELVKRMGGSYDMVSVLPKREHQPGLGIFVQPLRYLWEFALPSWAHKHPPVLSTCWAIRHETLMELGGMKGIAQAVIPEVHLARQVSTGKNGDRYSFLINDATLGVASIKNTPDQITTALRSRYPQLEQNMITMFGVSLLLLLLVLQYVGLMLGIIGSSIALIIASVIGVTLLSICQALLMWQYDRKHVWLSPFIMPTALLTEIVIIHLSFYRYELGSISWKGRPINEPVLQTIPKLPRF